MNLSTLFRAYSIARAKADWAWAMWWFDDGDDRLYKKWKRYAVLSRKLHNRIISGLEAAEEFSEGLVWLGGYKENPAREEQDE